MGLFNFSKSKKVDILSIPCDYDGYDISFEEKYTDKELYKEINNIITNNNIDINTIEEFNNLNINSSIDEFIKFYDNWLFKLRENNYVVHLDNSINIVEFTNGINNILSNIDSNKKLDVELISDLYNNKLKEYSFNGKDINSDFNYDILEANIVVSELRKIGYELICLFIGYDNNDKTIIKISDIDRMKDIESRINNK